ncbi:GNAT family N-acetyltransferase [Halalkalibaculum sp. DA3122]|uniref:GNAT family N-acetyltransferase n=1 Tax=Halalkalibaculum sp. DA3122 TaxID=3373607 RepID=UPI00375531E7
MSIEIEIVDKSAIKRKDVLEVLEKLDDHYTPPISSLVDLTTYAGKIVQNAEILFIKSGTKTVGMSAVYCNDYDNYTAFITTIGMIKEYQGQGLGKKLLEKSIELARSEGMREIKLEVHKDNISAINFYKRNYFIVKDEKLRLLSSKDRQRWLIMGKMI